MKNSKLMMKSNQSGGSYSSQDPSAPANQLQEDQVIAKKGSLYKRGELHTKVTKKNAKAAIKDDKKHMTYLKEDVNKDQEYGGKYKDENQTADEKHISKLAGDVNYDRHIVNEIAGRNSRMS